MSAVYHLKTYYNKPLDLMVQLKEANLFFLNTMHIIYWYSLSLKKIFIALRTTFSWLYITIETMNIVYCHTNHLILEWSTV